MEKDIQLGSVGDLELKLSGGKATLTVKAAVPGAALTAGLVIEMDASVLVDKLFDAIETALPAGKPVEEAIKMAVKAALSSI